VQQYLIPQAPTQQLAKSASDAFAPQANVEWVVHCRKLDSIISQQQADREGNQWQSVRG